MHSVKLVYTIKVSLFTVGKSHRLILSFEGFIRMFERNVQVLNTRGSSI